MTNSLIERGDYTCWHFVVVHSNETKTALVQYDKVGDFPGERNGCSSESSCGKEMWPCHVDEEASKVILRWKFPAAEVVYTSIALFLVLGFCIYAIWKVRNERMDRADCAFVDYLYHNTNQTNDPNFRQYKGPIKNDNNNNRQNEDSEGNISFIESVSSSRPFDGLRNSDVSGHSYTHIRERTKNLSRNNSESRGKESGAANSSNANGRQGPSLKGAGSQDINAAIRNVSSLSSLEDPDHVMRNVSSHNLTNSSSGDLNSTHTTSSTFPRDDGTSSQKSSSPYSFRRRTSAPWNGNPS